jgi:hypothetical protein
MEAAARSQLGKSGSESEMHLSGITQGHWHVEHGAFLKSPAGCIICSPRQKQLFLQRDTEPNLVPRNSSSFIIDQKAWIETKDDKTHRSESSLH